MTGVFDTTKRFLSEIVTGPLAPEMYEIAAATGVSTLILYRKTPAQIISIISEVGIPLADVPAEICRFLGMIEVSSH